MPGCAAQVRAEVDYRKVDMIAAFVGRHGMLLGRHGRPLRAATQRKAARAIKNARQMALMPFVGLHPAFADEDTLRLQAAFEVLDAEARVKGQRL